MPPLLIAPREYLRFALLTWIAVALWAAAPASAAKTCAGRKATLVGTAGNDRLVSKHRDVIVAGAGDDRILGLGGSDIICAGPGNDTITGGRGIDRIYGEDGDDQIFGQLGTDFIHGGSGNDLIVGGKGTDFLSGDAGNDMTLGDTGTDHINGGDGTDRLVGGAGNDQIDGGPGDGDVLYGGPGDDPLNGGPGNGDHVYGGLGADQVNGGPGDFDVVRGDEGFDHMDGGGGSHDIASFATDSPPGAGGFGFNGVYVDLPNGIAYGAGFGVGKTHGTDMLSNVEDVIGSPFDDKIVGDGQDNRIDAGLGNDTIDGGAGTNQVDGGPGSNICSNYSQQGSICNRSSQPAPNTTYVGVGSALDGFSTVFVVGGAADDHIQVSASGSAFTVSDSAGLTTDASSLTPAGTGCALDASAMTATCVSSSISGIDSLALGGGAGPDSISIDGSVPRTLAAYLDGGDGNDVVNGGPEDDFIQGGESGQDMLDGGGGDDSLQSDTGADVLSARRRSDRR